MKQGAKIAPIHPFLLGLGLAFWGWASGFWVWGLAMGALLSLTPVANFRLNLSGRDFVRISDVCSVLFVGIVVYVFISQKTSQALLVILQWFPFALIPLMAAQLYSGQRGVDLGVLLWSERKLKEPDEPRRQVDMSHTFFLVCLVSAGVTSQKGPFFYLGVATLAGMALWPYRPRRYGRMSWGAVLALALVLGFGIQAGLTRTQEVLEQWSAAWFERYMQRDADPYRAITAIGEISDIKLHDRIVFRVRPQKGTRLPLLLREASYDSFRDGMWIAGSALFKGMAPVEGKAAWMFGAPGPGERSLLISQYLSRGKGVLKLPKNTRELSNLAVESLQKNRLGAIKVADDDSSLLLFRARHGENDLLDGEPGEKDLSVPGKNKALFEEVAGSMGLEGRTPAEIVDQVRAYFEKDFFYTLDLEEVNRAKRPLAAFLKRARAGHCEFFATSTVLLLRQAGVPARYAVGFSAQEADLAGGWLAVRERHAHAWAMAWVGGQWVNVDTTPSEWIGMEEESAPWWQSSYDLVSHAWFLFSKWRIREGRETAPNWLWYVLIPLVCFLLWRILFRAYRGKKGKQKAVPAFFTDGRGLDSDYFEIERELARRGFGRQDWETPLKWVNRLERIQAPVHARQLRKICLLHYQYRFDPKGLSRAKRKELSRLVGKWKHDFSKINGQEGERAGG